MVPAARYGGRVGMHVRVSECCASVVSTRPLAERRPCDERTVYLVCVGSRAIESACTWSWTYVPLVHAGRVARLDSTESGRVALCRLRAAHPPPCARVSACVCGATVRGAPRNHAYVRSLNIDPLGAHIWGHDSIVKRSSSQLHPELHIPLLPVSGICRDSRLYAHIRSHATTMFCLCDHDRLDLT